MQVGEIIFSGGTYLVQIIDDHGTEHWPLLHFDDHGRMKDALCACGQQPCSHLAAASQAVQCNGRLLHRKWENSFWKALGSSLCEHFGYDTLSISGGDGEYKLKVDGEAVGAITTGDQAFNALLKPILIERVPETEENSIKFSDRTAEEISHWRDGRPGQALRFELSIWADLCKVMFLAQERGLLQVIRWLDGDELPQQMDAILSVARWQQQLPRAAWPQLVPTLSTVPSELQEIASTHSSPAMVYDPLQISFSVICDDRKDQQAERQGVRVGDWLYLKGSGFTSVNQDIGAYMNASGHQAVSDLLRKHAKIIAKYLREYPVHLDAIPIKISLTFNEEWDLVMTAGLFEAGDLDGLEVQQFGKWIFVPSGRNKGFWCLNWGPLNALTTIIKAADVDDFIARYRTFLNSFPGFGTHLTPLDTQLSYRIADNNDLCFVNLLEEREERGSHDFGEWVYLPEQGFFQKLSGSLGTSVRSGMRVKEREVSGFITKHKQELAQIPQFFAKQSPLKKCGLCLARLVNGSINITPVLEYCEGVNPAEVHLYGDYIYQQDMGFWELPISQRLPGEYQRPQLIGAEHIHWFIAKELDALRPFILELDPQLEWAQGLQPQIVELTAHEAGWQVKLHYQSNIGAVNAVQLWQGARQHRGFVVTAAGLIDLSDETLRWVKDVSKQHIAESKDSLLLSHLELLRMMHLYQWQAAEGASAVSDTLKQLFAGETELAPNLAGFLSELRPYQVTGLHWLWSLYQHNLGALLCDDMGLGKTHQAMALMSAVSNLHANERQHFLVVCPTSVIYHWEAQVKRFLPQLRVHTYHGQRRSLDEYHSQGGVLLTSYGILRSSKDFLKDYAFQVAIFDEAQYAKNPHSHTHAALRAVKAKMAVALSGTPIENNLRELKSLFDIVVPGYMPSDHQFREMFVTPIERVGSAERKGLLAQFIRPFVLRRRKSEVLSDLPEKIEELAECELSEEQRLLYTQTWELGRRRVMDELAGCGNEMPYMHIFTLLRELKGICNHPALVLPDAQSYKHHQSGKWELFCELLQEALQSGQKVVVFSHYLKMLDLIEEYLKDISVGFAAVRGATTQRAQEFERFQTDPNCQVFLGSLGAVGVGVDLSAASVVIHYDRWWNAAREEQATDRVHRIGQTRGVQVFKLMTRNTIEESIDKMIARKGALLREVVLSDEQSVIKRFNRQELLELLQLVDPVDS